MANHNVEAIRCKKCKHPYKEHGPGGKCLFEASSFEDYEELRVAMAKDINFEAVPREVLEKKWGQVWDTKEVQQVFQIHGFLAPFVSVTRRADGVKGALTFQHLPRLYFAFQPEP
jgi:hypothetical protein